MPAKRVEGVEIERAADEILAVKTATSEAHALNQSAAVVYELCDGKTHAAEMAAEIQRRTGLPADEEIVNLALTELIDAGLVQDWYLTTSPKPGGEPNTPLYPRPLDRRLILSKHGTGSESGVMFQHFQVLLKPDATASGAVIESRLL